MHPPVLPFFDQPTRATAPVKPRSYVERVAAYFKERPNCWIDGMALAEVGGIYAWRSRCAECRREPFNMTIENRQRKEGDYTISEYRYVPR